MQLASGELARVRRKLRKMNNSKKVTALLKLCWECWELGSLVGKRLRPRESRSEHGGGEGLVWALVDSELFISRCCVMSPASKPFKRFPTHDLLTIAQDKQGDFLPVPLKALFVPFIGLFRTF